MGKEGLKEEGKGKKKVDVKERLKRDRMGKRKKENHLRKTTIKVGHYREMFLVENWSLV